METRMALIEQESAPMIDATILTIDDDAGLRELAQEVFEREGYRAIVVPSVAAGLTVLGALTVDLVLLGHDANPLGDAAFVRAARLRTGAGLPIVLWTTLPRAAERASAMGADGVIEKPTDLDVVLARVRQEIAAAPSRRLGDDPACRLPAPMRLLAS